MAGQPAPTDVCPEFFGPRPDSVFRFAVRFGLSGPQALVRVGLLLGLLAWLPLFVLSWTSGMLTSGAEVTFMASLGTHVRLLVAIPLYFVAERLFDYRARAALARLIEGRVIPRDELTRFGTLLRQGHRWMRRWVAEILALALVLLLSAQGMRTDLPTGLTTWRIAPPGHLSPAGLWYTVVSFPLFQFVLWRSVVRMGIWTQLLWRLGRLRLNLVPAHPDGAGGLGVLGVVQTAMSPFCFATSAVVVASLAERIIHGTAQLDRFAVPLLGLVAGVTALAIVPLAGFAPALLAARQEGLLDYGELASEYVEAFHRKWIRRDPPPDEPLLGSADFQSLADLASGYALVQSMRLIPMTRVQLFSLLGAAAAPALPLVLFVTPFDELILHTLRTILQV